MKNCFILRFCILYNVLSVLMKYGNYILYQKGTKLYFPGISNLSHMVIRLERIINYLFFKLICPCKPHNVSHPPISYQLLLTTDMNLQTTHKMLYSYSWKAKNLHTSFTLISAYEPFSTPPFSKLILTLWSTHLQ